MPDTPETKILYPHGSITCPKTRKYQELNFCIKCRHFVGMKVLDKTPAFVLICSYKNPKASENNP